MQKNDRMVGNIISVRCFVDGDASVRGGFCDSRVFRFGPGGPAGRGFAAAGLYCIPEWEFLF